jgi:hypothetical protein
VRLLDCVTNTCVVLQHSERTCAALLSEYSVASLYRSAFSGAVVRAAGCSVAVLGGSCRTLPGRSGRMGTAHSWVWRAVSSSPGRQLIFP